MADILVIDDNQHMRRLVERILTAAGHTVTEARGGSEGLVAFRRAPPAMVITDIIMEDGEGIQTIRALHRKAPAIAHTGDVRQRYPLSAHGWTAGRSGHD